MELIQTLLTISGFCAAWLVVGLVTGVVVGKYFKSQRGGE